MKSGGAGSGEVVIHGPATCTCSKTSGNNGSAVRYVQASSELGDGNDSQIMVNLSVLLGLAREMVQMQRNIEQRAQQEFKPAWEELPSERNKQSGDEDRVVTCRRVTEVPLNDAHGDRGQDGDVEIESRKFHCSATILVPGDHGRRAMEVKLCLIVELESRAFQRSWLKD